MERQWKVRRRAPQAHFARFADLPWPVAQLLYHRGVTSPSEADAFFARQVADDNPFYMRGMVEAVTRIRQAITRGERIIVHGDFDADGVTSTAVMVAGLHALGARVAPYIPHRVDEGYGLHQEAITKMHGRGVSLVVTVDCGIRSTAEIELANRLGMDVVVTDHHAPPAILPPAYAIVNPHQAGCEYPHKRLAGVG
ncbi:MAG: DHH family phosphoesterase, partial [Ardenticatenaceae bacterium]